jgi:hypothetical protein
MPLLRHISQFWQQMQAQRLGPIATGQCIGLAIAAIALWGLYEIVESILVQHSQWLDLHVLITLRQSPLPAIDPILWRVAQAGEPPVLGLACALAMTCLIGQRQWIPASMVAIGSLGALALNPLVQSLFPPPTSALWRQLTMTAAPTLMLHAATSLLVYGLLGFLLARRYGRWRWAIAAGTVLLIGGVGGSRVALGLQGLIGLLTGYTVDLLWLLACLLALTLWREPTTVDRLRRRPPTEVSRSEPADPLKF